MGDSHEMSSFIFSGKDIKIRLSSAGVVACTLKDNKKLGIFMQRRAFHYENTPIQIY